MAFKKSKLFAAIWDGCNKLRGGMDSSQYKDYVLTLLFVKYVSDKAGDPKSIIKVPKGASFQDMGALKGKPDIGDKINQILSALTAANSKLFPAEAFTEIDFNSSAKLGSPKDMVDRLSGLVGVFENPDLDFKKHRAGQSDILGDAYEYLMKKFAKDSGKSKGEFYTPGEVSVILARLIGAHMAQNGQNGAPTLYDPTCGSGSLLLRCYSEAFETQGVEMSVHGQEKDITTHGLAKMNMVLHGVSDAVILRENTISSPQFVKSHVTQAIDGMNQAKRSLQTFKYIVANPPFSSKAWSIGIDPQNDSFGRFEMGVPPPKNGDYAFVQHITASLDADGKAAVVLPHGVLFRGNAEAVIRKALIKKGWVRAIVGLPVNLFFGTTIPACILLLDKERAVERKGIYMIDASKGFIKEGKQSKLRERDMRKILDAFEAQAEIEKFSRFVPYEEIERNDWNLNLPRYIDSSEPEDVQDLGGHLQGGIPQSDIDGLEILWKAAPSLKEQLFRPMREGYFELRCEKTKIREVFESNAEIAKLKKEITTDFASWREKALEIFRAFAAGGKPRRAINQAGDEILRSFQNAEMLDKYDVFQKLMESWEESIQDDLFVVADSEDNKEGFKGWLACKDVKTVEGKSKAEFNIEIGSGKGRKRYQIDVVEPVLVAKRFFAADWANLEKKEADLARAEQAIEEAMDELGGEDSPLSSYIEDGKFMAATTESKPKLTSDEKAAAKAKKEEEKELAAKEKQREKAVLASMPKEERKSYKANQEKEKALLKAKKEVAAIELFAMKGGAERLKAVADYEQEFGEDAKAVRELLANIAKAENLKSEIAAEKEKLWALVLEKIRNLTEEEIKALVIEDKWLGRLSEAIDAEAKRVLQSQVARIEELGYRYETKLDDLEEKRAKLLQKTHENMKLLGF